MPDRSAPGLIVEGLEARDMAMLDAFEGDEYWRETIDVQLAGALVQAQAYLPVIEIPAESPIWSLQHWTTAHKPIAFTHEARTARELRQRLSNQI